jgi:hypothetical protein
MEQRRVFVDYWKRIRLTSLFSNGEMGNALTAEWCKSCDLGSVFTLRF